MYVHIYKKNNNPIYLNYPRFRILCHGHRSLKTTRLIITNDISQSRHDDK